MYEKKRIYIVVKTYPTISKEYSELVCTAGFLEDGSWIRLYPVPFRKLELDQKYTKYTWIEVNVTRNIKDFRAETYRPDLATLTPNSLKSTYRIRNCFKNSFLYLGMFTNNN